MPNGQCHLCGSFGPLTFEHVPPSAAFNDHRVLEADIHKLIGSDLLEDLKNPTGNTISAAAESSLYAAAAITIPADGMVAPKTDACHVLQRVTPKLRTKASDFSPLSVESRIG